MKITVNMLKARRSCKPQVELFKAMGFDGVEITKRLCATQSRVFDWMGSACALLSTEQETKFYKLSSAAFDRFTGADESKREEALADFNEACAKAFYIASKC